MVSSDSRESKKLISKKPTLSVKSTTNFQSIKSVIKAERFEEVSKQKPIDYEPHYLVRTK
jgi:hypothetical protein